MEPSFSGSVVSSLRCLMMARAVGLMKSRSGRVMNCGLLRSSYPGTSFAVSSTTTARPAHLCGLRS